MHSLNVLQGYRDTLGSLCFDVQMSGDREHLLSARDIWGWTLNDQTVLGVQADVRCGVMLLLGASRCTCNLNSCYTGQLGRHST